MSALEGRTDMPLKQDRFRFWPRLGAKRKFVMDKLYGCHEMKCKLI